MPSHHALKGIQLPDFEQSASRQAALAIDKIAQQRIPSLRIQIEYA